MFNKKLSAICLVLLISLSVANQQGGSSKRSNEIVLRSSEDYSLRFEASTAGYTDYILEWYEHTPKNEQ